jgi:hypothetical protein
MWDEERYHKGLDQVFKTGKNAGKTMEEVAKASPDTIFFLAYQMKPPMKIKKVVIDLANSIKYPQKKK